jgi:hypothetical protein
MFFCGLIDPDETYDPAPPESKQVYDIIVKFFDRHLGARK